MKLIEKKKLLPEDVLDELKNVVLQPLKNRNSMYSVHEFAPIIDSSCSNRMEMRDDLRIGVVILAGGKGRRLGLSMPKGMLEVGGKSLYEILLNKARGVEKVGILTSPVTFKETQTYLKGRNIDFFEKKVYPTEEGNGVSIEISFPKINA